MTTDLKRRLQDHNSAISKWTKYRGPWKLVWSQVCSSISEARKLENKLKRQGRGSGFYRMIGLTFPSRLIIRQLRQLPDRGFKSRPPTNQRRWQVARLGQHAD